MIDTTHIPDSITPVIGWRAWKVHELGCLISLTGTLFYAGRWLPIREEARCHLHPLHSAPQPDCSCGFYALQTMDAAKKMLPESLWMATHLAGFDNPSAPYAISAAVMGTVELTGNICDHEGGWRAQYAKVRSLNYLRLFFPDSIDHQVAMDYIDKLSTHYPGTISPVLLVDLVGPDPPPEPRRTISLDDDQEIRDYIPLGFSKGEAVLRGRQWIYQLRLMDITGGRFDNFERPITLFNAEYFKLQELASERETSILLAMCIGWGSASFLWMDFSHDAQLYRPDGGIHTTLSATSPWTVSADYSLDETIVTFEEATNNVRPWKVQRNVPSGSAGWGGYEFHFPSLNTRDYARESNSAKYDSYMFNAFLNPRPDRGVDLKQWAMDLLKIEEAGDAK